MESFRVGLPGRGLSLEVRLIRLAMVAALLIGIGAAVGSAVATAAETPSTLWTRCAADTEEDVSCEIPRGIGTDPNSGHVFVADAINFRVDEFTALGSFVRAWGAAGSGSGQFGGFGPQGIAVDNSGAVYVVDVSNRRVEKFDSEGHFTLMFGGEVNETKSEELGSTEGERNLCPVDPGDVCQAGVEGTGDGQFGEWKVGSFIVIDPSDKVYVGDQNRIQRFDTGGVYQGEIALPGNTVQSLASDAAGNLYAVYNSKAGVHKITPAGVELSSPKFEVGSPSAVAVDMAGNVYAFDPSVIHLLNPVEDKPPIFKFDAEGHLIANFGKGEFSNSTGLATNLCPGGPKPGNLYVVNSIGAPDGFLRAYGPEPTTCGKAITGAPSEITEPGARLNGEANPKGLAVTECFFEYGPTKVYGETAPCAESSGKIGTGSDPVPVHADVGGLTGGTVYHVRLVVGTASGTEAGSDKTFKTLGPPVVSAEHVAAVAYTEATLNALVNPEGFPTEYHFVYGTDEHYGQSTPTVALGHDREDHPVIANIKGLTPGTTYHWRVVATNTAVRNGGVTEGEDHTFTTFLQPAPETGCGNEVFRAGASGFLPDCRAYEMVSPVDKNGGDILRPFEGYVQTSEDGERFTYSAPPTFGDQPSSLLYNQYLASRQEGQGWSTAGISTPVGERKPLPEQQFGAREFVAFSPDLCSAWVEDNLEPALAPEGQDGYVNIYRRDNCGAGGYETLTTSEPPAGTEIFYVNIRGQSIAGYSADSSQAIFAAKAKLTPDAANTTNGQIYDRFDNALHLVSVLPNGKPAANNAGVGGGPALNLDNAVSTDGSYVYWAAGLVEASGTGKIFVRQRPKQEQSAVVAGKCSQAAKACTLPVSSGNEAFYWTAAADGSKALYSEKEGTFEANPFEEGLFEFDLKAAEEGKPAQRLIAEHVHGVVGASDDLSRIYFVSTDALTGGQENNFDDKAEEGKYNLYLAEEEAITFIGTLIPGDVAKGLHALEEARGYQVDSEIPYTRAARVSADGSQVAFQSRAQLTHFDNTDVQSGEADAEVFTYKAGGALECVSCNPGGVRPSGAPELREPFIRLRAGARETHVFASAWIQTWEHPLYASHVLSDNGGRLFFHSYEALVPRDTNGVMDVYEWEAPGEGSCTGESHAFHAANGGCIFLISTGESPFESEFWDASPDGRDVFFSTESSLVAKDPGQVDLYDAREGGGFAEASQKAACEGEACQNPPPPPLIQTPASAGYKGPGNVSSASPRCPKGKHRVTRKGKASCAKPKKNKNKNKNKNKQKGGSAKPRASHNRGARR